MKIVKSRCRCMRCPVGIALLAFVLFSTLRVAALDQTLPLLKTKTAIYTNVTVTTITKKYIFILHPGGMANIKLQDLPDESLQALGLLVPDAAPKQPVMAMAKQLTSSVHSKLKPLEDRWRKQFPGIPQKITLTRNAQYTVLGITAALYLFLCYCCHLICLKSKQAASILVWVPGLQFIPMLHAANMSGWWFLVCFVPLVNILVSILWAVNIVKVRGKGVVLTVLLLLPVTNLLAFLYLAFSQEAPADDGPRYKSMSLQTA